MTDQRQPPMTSDVTDATVAQLAWSKNAVGFIRERGLEREFSDWCGGWPVPAELAARPLTNEVETWESINQWCDETFGLATVPQIIARAKEEFDELETDGCDPAIEAADVVICLCRIPGFADALQRKMAINRKRKWRLVGNGTGYHIPEAALNQSGGEAEPSSTKGTDNG